MGNRVLTGKELFEGRLRIRELEETYNVDKTELRTIRSKMKEFEESDAYIRYELNRSRAEKLSKRTYEQLNVIERNKRKNCNHDVWFKYTEHYNFNGAIAWCCHCIMCGEVMVLKPGQARYVINADPDQGLVGSKIKKKYEEELKQYEEQFISGNRSIDEYNPSEVAIKIYDKYASTYGEEKPKDQPQGIMKRLMRVFNKGQNIR